NRPQAAEDPIELFFAQRQRVAAADQHVANLGRLPNVFKALFQAGLARHNLAVPDNARPRAVAAVGRAEIEGQEQNAVRIAVYESGSGAVAILTQRIVGLAGRAEELTRYRNDRSPQRLRRVLAVEQAHVIGRDADRQHRLALHESFALV